MPNSAHRILHVDQASRPSRGTEARGASGNGPDDARTRSNIGEGRNDQENPQDVMENSATSQSGIFTFASQGGSVDQPGQSLPARNAYTDEQFPENTPISAVDQNNYFPGGPISWDWGGTEDYQDIAERYEPQGELLNEIGDQRDQDQDFDIREITPNAPQIQSYFSDSFKGSVLNHPQLREQLAANRQQHTSGTSLLVPQSAGGKRKEITTPAAENNEPGPESPAKRVAFSGRSPEEPNRAEGQGPEDQRPQRNQEDGANRKEEQDSIKASNVRSNDSRSRSSNRATAPGESQARRQKLTSQRNRSVLWNKKMVLPAGKVFPIQIGSELFRLSGASISSDAPSYFSDFFGEQLASSEGGANIKTLYIDRDPVTFRDISLHLQGMQSIRQRTTDIGDRHFSIPRDIFSSPGDTPNYFSLGFAIFFSTPNEVFPGLDHRGLLRPPSITPPAVLNRSADIFAEILHVLQGYPIHIRDEEHRAALLRDARYFHLKGLEQKLIPHSITYNHLRQQSEITIRLEDLRQSGISFTPDHPSPTSELSTSPIQSGTTSQRLSPAPPTTPSSQSQPPPPQPSATTTIHPSPGWVHYARPYVDDTAHSLILEIGSETTRLDLSTSPPRASFIGKTHDRISALLGVIASKMNLPATSQPLGLMMLERSAGGAGAGAGSGAATTTQGASPSASGLSEERVKVLVERSADVVVDGEAWVVDGEGNLGPKRRGEAGEVEYEAIFEIEGKEGRGRARRRMREVDGGVEERSKSWVVRNGLWRLRAQGDGKGGLEVVLVAVKIEAFSGERAKNGQRKFLS
ncbi:MAG: hypothetical protein M1820_003546 [Bogoriella megaspora]|nr:MAG: hypothetical protein M1820_003546 [Bogoriella megaspora]